MSYDSSTRTFTVYSEDKELIGNREITLVAQLAEYPEVISQQTSTSIEILEYFGPCAFISIHTPDQMNPPDYLYTRDGLQFNLNSFSIDQIDLIEECSPIVYSCEVVSGPRTDLCSFTEGSSSATFDKATG